MKVVDERLLTGTDDSFSRFNDGFDMYFKLEEVVHGPGILRFYSSNVIQSDEWSVTIHADCSPSSIDPFLAFLTRRRQVVATMNEAEKKSLLSMNALIGLLGIISSPLSLYYASYLH